MAYDDAVVQPGQLFLIGHPSNYRWPSLETSLPYLWSYMSVHRKDRQLQIHMMIAERFGLSSPVLDESPPTYEESVCQPVVVPCSGFRVSDTALLPAADSHHIEPSTEMREAVSEQCSAPNACWAPLPVYTVQPPLPLLPKDPAGLRHTSAVLITEMRCPSYGVTGFGPKVEHHLYSWILPLSL